MDGDRTVVAVLDDGTEVFVKHWPNHDGPEIERWKIATRDPAAGIWGPPALIVRVEERT